ncbi:MAG: LysR substrate-binding domain-containing protein [Solirubrobacteraceae bacterium]
MDVHTRKLRYFVAVAEELHFGRAATRLFVAQQALSKQIRELEREVGAELLRRTTRRVELTAAGEVFLDATRTALDVLDAAADAARRARHGEAGTLRLGFGVGAAVDLTAPLLAELAERHPDIDLEMRELGFDDPSAGLRDGSTDVAIVRLPLATVMESEVLFAEPLVLVVHHDHPFARRETVTAREAAREPMIVGRNDDAEFERFWTLADHRDGDPEVPLRRSSSHTEELELVAAGLVCFPTAASAARYTPHTLLRFIPISDAEPSRVAVGWTSARRSALVDHFVEVAREVRDRERAIVRRLERPFDEPGIRA